MARKLFAAGIQRILHQCGVHLARYPLRSEYENVLHDFLIGFDIGCVVDVGANVGRFGLALRRLGYTGRIISFEPVPATVEHLQRSAARDPLWDVHCLALGASDGQARIHLYAGSENATLAEVTTFARGWMPSALQETGYVDVPLRRLDSLMAEGVIPMDAPALLKIDAEGFDWEVMAGAGSRVADFAGVQMELMVQPVWQNAPPMGESLLRLAELGFQPAAFSVANRAHFSAIVIDGLFVNTRFQSDPARAARMWNSDGMGLAPQLWANPAAHRPSSRARAVGASWSE